MGGGEGGSHVCAIYMPHHVSHGVCKSVLNKNVLCLKPYTRMEVNPIHVYEIRAVSLLSLTMFIDREPNVFLNHLTQASQVKMTVCEEVVM